MYQPLDHVDDLNQILVNNIDNSNYSLSRGYTRVSK